MIRQLTAILGYNSYMKNKALYNLKMISIYRSRIDSYKNYKNNYYNYRDIKYIIEYL